MAIIRGLDNDLSLDEANRIQMMKLEEKVNFFHILLHICKKNSIFAAFL